MASLCVRVLDDAPIAVGRAFFTIERYDIPVERIATLLALGGLPLSVGLLHGSASHAPVQVAVHRGENREARFLVLTLGTMLRIARRSL
jgi:hypothetical protein